MRIKSFFVIVSLFVSIFLYPMTAFASSAYDNNYKTTDNLKVFKKHPNSAYNVCPTEQDITTDWSQYILDANKWYSGFTQMADYRTSFQTALASGRWGVTQVINYGSTIGTQDESRVVYVYWTEDTSLTLAWDWDPNSIFAYSSTGHLSAVAIQCITNQISGVSTPDIIAAWPQVLNAGAAYWVSNSYTTEPQTLFRNFLFYGNQNLPANYGGTPIVESATPKTVVTPHFTYILSGRDLQATYKDNLKGVVNNLGGLTWTLFDSDNNLIDQQTTSLYQTYNYTFSIDGTYSLWLTYNTNAPILVPDDLIVLSTQQVLTINGQSIIGNTDQNECEVVDDEFYSCGDINPLEDCSSFGTDIIGALGCHLNNFWIKIKTWFMSLFIFSKDRWQVFADTFSEYSTSTYGLTSIITAPVTILNNIKNGNYTCSSFSLPFVGSATIIIPCLTSFYSGLGVIFTLYQTIASGLISYYVIVGFLRSIKEFKDPQHDRIEVMQL